MSIVVNGTQVVYTASNGASGTLYNIPSSYLVQTEVGSVAGYAAQAQITVSGGASDYQYLCSEQGDTQVDSFVYIGDTTYIEGVTDNSAIVCPAP
jgi:hypothetical protein